MTSEPNAAITAIVQVSPLGMIDSQDGHNAQHRGQSWWRVGASASGRSLTMGERNAAVAASLHGQLHVITGNRDAVELCHLLPKSMTGKEVQDLQYSFGQNLNLNSRWFLFYLASHLHRKFDNNDRSWALIPAPSMITSIADKMCAETERRLQLGITGSWPDYQQVGWFPITTTGFNYHLIALGLAHPAGDPIYYDADLDDPNASLEDIQRFRPSFTGFPILNLHAHPYAVIMNAYPKLEKHLQTQELPPLANTNFDDIKFIYDIWTKSAQQSQPSAALSTQQQKPLHGSNAPTRANSPGTHYPLCSHPSTQSTHSHLGSAERDTYDDSFDNMDTPDALMSKDANSTSWTLLRCTLCSQTIDRPRVQLEHSVHVHARHPQSTPLRLFVSAPWTNAEPARAPPTLDWHDWESEFAPWWVLYRSSRNGATLKQRLGRG